jgi:hypothetical protein
MTYEDVHFVVKQDWSHVSFNNQPQTLQLVGWFYPLGNHRISLQDIDEYQ